jgi:VWFA-related protein
MRFACLLFPALLIAQQRPDIRVDVDLVTVQCAVSDHGGAPVRDLKVSDFSLRDNGQHREISNFWQESELPLTIALVGDVSGSQMGFIKSHRDAVAQFLKQVIGPEDRAMIVQIAQQARLLAPLTGSIADLSASVQSMGTAAARQAPMLGPPCEGPHIRLGCGGTALWHGLYYAAKELKPVTGRKAIIVLSDGMDTGSDIKLTDLIEMAQSADVVVYSMKYASRMRYTSISATIAQAVSHGLERLSRETGGLTFPNPGSKTSEVFAQIESDLRNLYVLGFTPPEDARDGKFHKLEIALTRKDLVARSRAGYWASVAKP